VRSIRSGAAIVMLLALGHGLPVGAQETPPPAPATPSEPPTRQRVLDHDRIGPFALEGPDGSFRPTFAMQVQAWGEDAEGQLDGNATVRRLRLGFTAHLLDDRIGARLQINVWPSSLELLDAYLDFRVTRTVRLRVGQQKIPFTRYRQGSFTALPLVDWAIVGKYFGAERQLGVGLAWEGDGGFTVDAGVFQGPNRRASFATELTRLYGESPTDASNLASPGPAGDYHPELVARAGHHSEDFGAMRLSEPEGGGLRHAVDVGVTGDLQPQTTEDLALRFAAEALLKYEHFAFQGIWFQTGFHPTTGGVALGTYGLLYEGSYRIDRHLEVSLRYAQTWVPAALRHDARARADGRIASATTPEEMDSLAAQYASVGQKLGDIEAGVGFNVYFVGDSLKWQTDLRWLRTRVSEGAGANLDDAVVRTQLQLTF